MKFGNLRNKFKNRSSLFLKSYFVLGSFILLLLFIMYSNHIIYQAKQEQDTAPKLFAHFFTYSTRDDFESLLLQFILDEVIAKVKDPIILTDAHQIPIKWRNVEINENKSYEELKSLEKRKLEFELKRMRKLNRVIPITYGNQVLGYTFYGESRSVRLLRYMPYLEMTLVVMFLLFGLYGLIIIKKTEKDLLWVGLAKETAHQFGTPITSLLGWISVLRIRTEAFDAEGDIAQMLSNMDTDLDRLKKIASRFGKVGSTIKKMPTNVNRLLEETIDYFKTRLPNMSNQVIIEYHEYVENALADIDAELFKWSIENLLKNAIDAMKLKGGTISVVIEKPKQCLRILISDEGSGIPKMMFKKVFEPGITTKSRGWGLGLSLCKRIVEEYHGGKIRVLESTVNKGTTFEINLPIT